MKLNYSKDYISVLFFVCFGLFIMKSETNIVYSEEIDINSALSRDMYSNPIDKQKSFKIIENAEKTGGRENTNFTNSGLFLPPVAYKIGSWAEAVAIGDVNGDGRNDVVITTSFYFDSANDYRIHVFLQNSTGELVFSGKYLTDGSYTNRPQTIDIGDVNNDGRMDIVVGNSGRNIEVFTQDTSGCLNPSVKYSTINSTKIKIGDVNNDGLMDVAGTGAGANKADVFLQNLSGTFDSAVTYNVNYAGNIDIGDANNDGLQDVVVMSGDIGVLLQQNNGTLGAPVYYDLGVNALNSGGAIGDINGDLSEDIIVTYGGNRPDSKIGVFLQNSNATFDSAISINSYDCPEPVEISDVDSDGKKDIIVLHGGWCAMGVYLQNDSGSLLSEELYSIPYASHYNPHGLAVGDINGDGKNDVVIADYNNGLVILYHVRNVIPKVSLSASDTTGITPLTVNFTATASDPDGSIVKYEWDFNGDGNIDENSGMDSTASFTYNTIGIYNAKVRVTDNSDSTADGIVQIKVNARSQPSVFLAASDTTGAAPLTVSFTAAASDPYHSIVKYEWDFNYDGNFERNTGMDSTTVYTYDIVGTYNVKVRVTDSEGASKEAIAKITVNKWVVSQPLGNIDITSPGSANRVDGHDLYVLLKAFGSIPGKNNWNPAADLDGNLIIDGYDLFLLAHNFGGK